MFRLPVGTQRMQMPLDCEATSLTIALAAVGVHTTQRCVQGHFPTDTRAPVLGANGLPSQWGDPYTDFVGHVMGSEPGSNPHWAAYAGWGAYAPVVARTAESLGVPVAAQLTGWNPQALYAAVEAGHPVLVWTTVNYSSQTARTWTAWDGRLVPWTEAGHVVVLMGVNTTAGTLEFSDPLTGSYNGTTMAQFARTFTIYGEHGHRHRAHRACRSTATSPCGTRWRSLITRPGGNRASNRTPRAVGSLAPRPHPEGVHGRRQRRRRCRGPRPSDERRRRPDAATWRCHSIACRGIEPCSRSSRDAFGPHAEATASMRWVTFTQSTYPGERTGLLVDGRIHACGPGTTLLGLLGDDGTLLAAEGDELRRDPHDVFELDSIAGARADTATADGARLLCVRAARAHRAASDVGSRWIPTGTSCPSSTSAIPMRSSAPTMMSRFRPAASRWTTSSRSPRWSASAAPTLIPRRRSAASPVIAS